MLVPDKLNGMPRFDAKARAEVAEAVVLKNIPRLMDMGKCPTDGKTSPDYLPKLMAEFKSNEGFTK